MINQQLQEKATTVLDRLRERLIVALDSRRKEVIDCIHESAGEVEECIISLLSNSALLMKFQQKEPEGYGVLSYAPYRTLLRIVDRFQSFCLMAKLFQPRLVRLFLPDAAATDKSEK